MIDSALQEELGSLGLELRSPRVVRGGDVCQALRGELADGRSVFLKTLPGAPEDLFAAEAAGLDWMRHASLYELAGTGDLPPDMRMAWSPGVAMALAALTLGALAWALERRAGRKGS